MVAKLFLFLSTFLLVHFAFERNTCIAQTSHRLALDFDSCRLNIYSPFGCYYSILFDSKGESRIKEFTNDAAEDSLLSARIFQIKMTDLNRLDEILGTIKGGDTIRSPRMFDSYRYSLYINKKKYVDVYGQNGKIDSILRILLKYSKLFNDKCGFFKLLRKAQGH